MGTAETSGAVDRDHVTVRRLDEARGRPEVRPLRPSLPDVVGRFAYPPRDRARAGERFVVYRYRLDGRFSDGLTGQEGTFSMCSFWYVECLSRLGDLHKTRFFFEKMLGYANHLGLYGEELGPQAEHLGNFPRAFTHLAAWMALQFPVQLLQLPETQESKNGQTAVTTRR